MARSKDKAQVTATTAMSVVQVTLLKEVIEKGPGSNYYVVSLVFIDLSLFLQVLAGLISIAINNMNAQLARSKKEVTGCTCAGLGRDVNCCGNGMVCCRISTLSPAEGRLIREYHDWQAETRFAKRAAVAEADIAHGDNMIAYIDEELRHAQDYAKYAADLTTKRADAMARRIELSLVLKENEMRSREGEMLRQRAEHIVVMDVMKRVTIWQHIVNFLLYLVFIINAFITGFGIAQ